MSKRIQVIIGSNYGDEGKGRMTRYFARKGGASSAVVRFNGGSQAGHTVVHGDLRHVFSHFGSGSFDNISTILTKDFVCSPLMFILEARELAKKGVSDPKVYVDPKCPITTPWDVFINQAIERHRGDGRHGSVGVGFGETVNRHGYFYPEFQLTVEDILHRPTLCMKINAILGEYLPLRLAELGLDNVMMGNLRHVYHQYELHCREFLEGVTLMDEAEALSKFDNLIFEGAQGLALDQESGDFPHVTRSFTGVDNVVRVLEDSGIVYDPINLCYITRPYLTRHGAGPLRDEVGADDLLFETLKIVDHTNLPQEFQGSLRIARMNIDDMAARITKDQMKVPSQRLGRISLAVTCVDQIVDADGFLATVDDETFMFKPDIFAAVTCSKMNATHVFLCHGEEDHQVVEGEFVDKRIGRRF